MTELTQDVPVDLLEMISNAKCFEILRQRRWPQGVRCPHCHSAQITKQGKDERQVERQRYFCKDCGKRFDDLTGTVFAKRHQPLRVWVLCLYLMGLNLSSRQIAEELDLSHTSAFEMMKQLRQSLLQKQPEVELFADVECDEAYVTAGHKGRPEAVKKKGVRGGGAS